MGALRLAFIGDAVQTLYVREKIATENKGKVPVLHSLVSKRVNAAAQSLAYDKIFPNLTPEEQDIIRRGKNARVGHIPKNQTIEDYHKATALESLLGYLYLSRQDERLAEILGMTGD